jgi:hypothetical protein
MVKNRAGTSSLGTPYKKTGQDRGKVKEFFSNFSKNENIQCMLCDDENFVRVKINKKINCKKSGGISTHYCHLDFKLVQQFSDGLKRTLGKLYKNN